MDERFEKLKRTLFNWGIDYIEDFLGFEVNDDWDDDTIENAMDEIYQQMPSDILEEFYAKFCVV